MKFYAEAYGCTMNRGETEMLAESWQREGHERVDRPEDADRALIGTCVVIRKTEERMKRRIKELHEICGDVVVTGCITTARSDELKKACPECESIAPSDIEITTSENRSEGEIKGIVPIATGCTGNCHYCITRIARGPLRSRPVSEIVDRFKSLLDQGLKEIQITCQDTASYGRDINSTLPELLQRLAEFKGNHRIRVGMMNPDTSMNILDELLNTYDAPQIYKFLHLPLQSGSDEILEKMNRKYTVDDWAHIVDEFKERFPDMTLSTDVIVGYPGERGRDFEKTKDIIEKNRPDILNVTRFSPRPGTVADQIGDLEDKVHSREKKKRSKELSDIHRTISSEKNREHIGETVETLILSKGKKNTFKGRTDDYRMVVVENISEKHIGRWINVKINSSGEVYLKGKQV